MGDSYPRVSRAAEFSLSRKDSQEGPFSFGVTGPVIDSYLLRISLNLFLSFCPAKLTFGVRDFGLLDFRRIEAQRLEVGDQY